MNKLDLSLAPKKGYCFACIGGEKAIFDKYKIVNNKIQYAKAKNINVSKLTEIHLFDSTKEFRAIYSDSSDDNIIAVLTKFQEKFIDPLYLKSQEIYLEEKYQINSKKKIRIISRYAFDNNNCLYLENYRLAGIC